MSSDTTQTNEHPLAPAAADGAPPARPAPDEATIGAAIAVVEALSVAWATMTAFEDPRGLEAFQRAVTLLGKAPWYPQRLDIGTEGFLLGDHPVAASREAAQRLARRLFAHGSGALEIASPPSADELMTVLRTIAEAPGDEDPGDHLVAAGVRSVVLIHRELLAAAGGAEDAPDVWYVEYQGDPSRFVDPLLVEHPDDPAGAARTFTDEYLNVLQMVAGENERTQSEIVHAFVDAFTNLPEGHQAAVISAMLHSQASAAEVFIDQLGSQQLGELASRLDPESQPLLVEYARIAAAHGERRHTELLALLDHEQETDRPLGSAIIAEVDAALRSGSRELPAAVARLHRLRRSSATDWTTVVNVTRGLFSVVDDEAFERIADAWAAKVATAVQSGDLRRSDMWFGAVVGIALPERRQSLLLKALGLAFDGGAIEAAARVVTGDRDGPGAGIRRAAPLFLAGPLIRNAATVRTPEARRDLLRALVVIARARPSGVMAYLSSNDPAQVAIAIVALGYSRSDEAVARIELLLRHRDPSIRVQALRSIIRLRGPAAVPMVLTALDDRDERVRALARKAVVSGADPRIDEALIARVTRAESLSAEVAAIALLGTRKSTEGTEFLRELAGRRWALRSRSRARRAAARAALEGAEE